MKLIKGRFILVTIAALVLWLVLRPSRPDTVRTYEIGEGFSLTQEFWNAPKHLLYSIASPDPPSGKQKLFIANSRCPGRFEATGIQEPTGFYLPDTPQNCIARVMNDYYVISGQIGASWRRADSSKPLNLDWNHWAFDSSPALFNYLLEFRRRLGLNESPGSSSSEIGRIGLKDGGFIHDRENQGFDIPYRVSDINPAAGRIELRQTGDNSLPKFLLFRLSSSDPFIGDDFDFDLQATEVANKNEH